MGSLLEGCRDSSQNQGSRGSLGAVRLWGAAELCFCPAAVGSTPGGGGWVAQTHGPWRPLRRGGGVPHGAWSSCWPAWDGPRQLQAASSLWWEQGLPGAVKSVPCCQNPDYSPTRQQRGLRAISWAVRSRAGGGWRGEAAAFEKCWKDWVDGWFCLRRPFLPALQTPGPPVTPHPRPPLTRAAPATHTTSPPGSLPRLPKSGVDATALRRPRASPVLSVRLSPADCRLPEGGPRLPPTTRTCSASFNLCDEAGRPGRGGRSESTGGHGGLGPHRT